MSAKNYENWLPADEVMAITIKMKHSVKPTYTVSSYSRTMQRKQTSAMRCNAQYVETDRAHQGQEFVRV